MKIKNYSNASEQFTPMQSYPEIGLELDNLSVILPQEFQFYSLGQVRLLKQLSNDDCLDPCIRIAYRISGEQGLMLTIFVSPNLDLSLCSEIGNVIAAKVASNLQRRTLSEWMISPPTLLTSTLVKELIVRPTYLALNEYCLEQDQQLKSLYVSISKLPGSEAGHA